MGAAVVQHCSPACGWWRNAESEKTHGGFGENGPCHTDRRLHDHRLNDVWKNVADDNAQVTRTEGAGGFDEFPFARREDLSANEPRVADPASEGEREN